MYIVKGYKAQPEDLVGDEEMADVLRVRSACTWSSRTSRRVAAGRRELGPSHVDATVGS
jgi:hypothetical protein